MPRMAFLASDSNSFRLGFRLGFRPTLALEEVCPRLGCILARPTLAVRVGQVVRALEQPHKGHQGVAPRGVELPKP